MIVHCPICLTEYVREFVSGIFKKLKEKCGVCLNEVVMLKGKKPASDQPK